MSLNRGHPRLISAYIEQVFWNLISLDCITVAKITLVYRVRQNKTPQHENRNFSEIREYCCTKFCSFVPHKLSTYLLDVPKWRKLQLIEQILQPNKHWFQFPGWLKCQYDVKKHPIYMIFGQRYPQGITHQRVINFPTLPCICRHTTSRSAKSHVSTMLFVCYSEYSG